MDFIAKAIHSSLTTILQKNFLDNGNIVIQTTATGITLDASSPNILQKSMDSFANIAPQASTRYTTTNTKITEALQLILSQIDPQPASQELFLNVKSQLEKIINSGVPDPPITLQKENIPNFFELAFSKKSLADSLGDNFHNLMDLNSIKNAAESFFSLYAAIDKKMLSKLHIQFRSLNVYSLIRGGWFSPELLNIYHHGPWVEGSSFANEFDVPFGKSGLLPLVPIKIITGINPTITLFLGSFKNVIDLVEILKEQFKKNDIINIGPFSFHPKSDATLIKIDRQNSSFSISDNSGLLKIYVVANQVMPYLLNQNLIVPENTD